MIVPSGSLLVVEEGRLEDQQICPGRQLRDAGTGASVGTVDGRAVSVCDSGRKARLLMLRGANVRLSAPIDSRSLPAVMARDSSFSSLAVSSAVSLISRR